MKRFLLLLPIFLLLLLAACNNTSNQNPVAFYYPNQEISYGDPYGLIGKELRQYDAKPLDALLKVYLEGPTDPAFRNPFPTGTVVLELSLHADACTLVLSDKYATLSGIDLTTANACLASTLFELTDANTITIQCRTKPLGGQESVLLTRATFLLADPIESTDERK